MLVPETEEVLSLGRLSTLEVVVEALRQKEKCGKDQARIFMKDDYSKLEILEMRSVTLTMRPMISRLEE